MSAKVKRHRPCLGCGYALPMLPWDERAERRILDVLLSALNGETYPINDVTRPELEEIIEEIDYQLDTGWTGEGYTVWMNGVGP
jgi:hypothetical protein